MTALSCLIALPEILLALVAMGLLVNGAIRGDRAANVTRTLAFCALIVAALLMFADLPTGNAFRDMFRQDVFSLFVKPLILVAAAMALVLSNGAPDGEWALKPEYPVLLLFATIGMMMMVSANNLMALYVGLELQALPLYVLAAFRRDNVSSSEAGLKYFVLGALSSGMLLYGMSLLYGFTGTLAFNEIAANWFMWDKLGPICGMVFVLAGLAFKISAVPFHMWTPDVYQGAPTPVTAFFATAPKLAAIAMIARVVSSLHGGWQDIVLVMAAASMLLGSFAGLRQTSLKRLMAYSSIANAGTALIGLALANAAGARAMLIYMVVYVVATLGVFGVMTALKRDEQNLDDLSGFSGLAKTHPLMALLMAVFMFSLTGMPPLAGFFGKYMLFFEAVRADMVLLAVFGVLTSVVSAYYYMRVVKIMYFDDPAVPQEAVFAGGPRYVAIFSAVALSIFVIAPTPILDGAMNAAMALFGR